MMNMTVVSTGNAPKAIGPYSQAIVTGGMVYCSGQIAIVPESGELKPGGIEEQTRQVLNNLKNVLEAAGSGMDKVVKTSVFLKDLGDFEIMNRTYAEFFPENKPARSTVEVARLPKDVLVEIDCIALI